LFSRKANCDRSITVWVRSGRVPVTAYIRDPMIL